MSPFLWTLVLLSQVALVASQILMKEAVMTRGKMRMAATLAVVVLWLLLWLGAMPRMELSKLVPFEGLSPLLTAIGAVFFLRERLNWQAWTGLALTCVGILLVSAS